MDFDSDIMCSTVTYPLPSYKSGQIGGQIGGQTGGQTTTIPTSNITDTEHDDTNVGSHNEVVRKGGQKSGDENRHRIIEAMRRKPEISRRELSAIIGISPSAIQKHIEYLKGAEIIIRLGSDRKGLWKVLK